MIGLIVAYSKNKVIGSNGHIPWNIKGELDRFKALTLNNIIIMGRKTFEDIGRILPNRTTIVVSKTMFLNYMNCFTVSSLEKALFYCNNRDVFIVGGSRLYNEAISIVDKMFVTEVEGEYIGDVFFPEFDESLFFKSVDLVVEGKYRYITYTRK